MDIDWMHVAFARTRQDGAVGVDGQTVEDYVGDDLAAKLANLLDRAKSGTYRAPPVRRVHIPKGTGGETRPIGIPTFEDKVLQRAVVMVKVSLPGSVSFIVNKAVNNRGHFGLLTVNKKGNCKRLSGNNLALLRLERPCVLNCPLPKTPYETEPVHP